MKKSVVLILICLVSASAFAVMNPDPNIIGIYFDTTADNNCLTIGTSVPFFAYLILTNPTAPAINYYEFGQVNPVPPGMENMIFRLSSNIANNSVMGIDDGTNNAMGGDYIVSLSEPLPSQSALILHSWQYMLLSVMPVEMYIGSSSSPTIPGDLAIVQNADGNIPMQVLQSTGWTGIPVATVNAACVTPTLSNIVIDPDPNGLNAPWHLDGLFGYALDGTGDSTVERIYYGGFTYTLTWGDVPGWITPSPNPVVQTLVAGGTITFSGTYIEDSEPPIGMPVVISDDTPGTATVDGTVNVGEYVGFSRGINSGFGDVIGAGSQLHVDSGQDGSLNWGLITGGGGLLNHAVIYIDSRPGGFGDTSSFMDIADPLRAAISAAGFLNIEGRADITFPAGFEADFAIGLEAAFAGVWELVDSFEHIYIGGATPTTTTPDHWEFALTLGDLGLVPGDSFDYIVTYGNVFDANGFYRSDEFHGVAGTTVPAGNIGINPVLLASSDFNTFHSYGSNSSLGEPGPPLVTRMLGAYPNPFNPRTELAFELATPATVSLEVYDLSGRRVQVLVQGVELETGRHSVLWQGRDEKGNRVSSGVYFCHLRTDDYAETMRMTLLK